MTWVFVLLIALPAVSAETKPDTSRGDAMIAAYFKAETAKLRDACLADVKTLDQWKAQRQVHHKQLIEMLGLDPMPERGDLKATVTGTVEAEDYTVEKLHYQSRPGLYVTANLYLPKDRKKPAPAILYLCGHGRVKKNGVSYGNKTYYHHHGVWFARHGYVCLMIDTLQLGEIEGLHHGTYYKGKWWWNNRGYTPAGVEAFNCIRALDYLQSRPEVDPERIGATGRSGGGAYSWWISAIDERIKVAAPVAGITDLENHVVDGCVEGHCDCMFMVNTYGWDYPMVAAMVAPRPLLICNTDSDRIFPLDGVVRTYNQVRKIYELYGAGDKLGLVITPGPHKDTQPLRVPVFTWFNKYLKGEDAPIDAPAAKCFEPEQLKVFKDMPTDQKNTKISETFTQRAASKLPTSPETWTTMRDDWRKALDEKCFRGWPKTAGPLDVQEVFSTERHGLCFRIHEFTSQDHIRLRIYSLHRAGMKQADSVTVNTLDQPGWKQAFAMMSPALEASSDLDKLSAEFKAVRDEHLRSDRLSAWVAPRGIGPTQWNQDERKRTHIRRRFMLLGQTIDGMRVWDVRRAIQAVRELPEAKNSPLELTGRNQMAGVALYASLYEPNLAKLTLVDLPASHREGPIFLNVTRYLDTPQAVAMAVERSPVRIERHGDVDWSYPAGVAKRLGWQPERLELIDADFERRQYKDAAGKTLPYRLVVPRGYEKSKDAHPLLIFLHGAGRTRHEQHIATRVGQADDAGRRPRLRLLRLRPAMSARAALGRTPLDRSEARTDRDAVGADAADARGGRPIEENVSPRPGSDLRDGALDGRFRHLGRDPTLSRPVRRGRAHLWRWRRDQSRPHRHGPPLGLSRR